jgi:hypothetical protein
VQGRGVSPPLERSGKGGAQRRSAQAKRGRLGRRLARARGRCPLRRSEDRVLFRRLSWLVDGVLALSNTLGLHGICFSEPEWVVYDNPTSQAQPDSVWIAVILAGSELTDSGASELTTDRPSSEPKFWAHPLRALVDRLISLGGSPS